MPILTLRQFSFICSFLFIFLNWNLLAQEKVSKRKSELGFSLDVSGPAPNSEWEKLLQPNIGLSAYYRFRWPYNLYNELGLNWFFLESQESQKVFLIPIHLLIGYRLPLESRLDVIFKGGLGTSYVEVRPANKHGWDPFAILGVETSILASRFFRIGVRLDYFYIYEKHLEVPEDNQNSPEVPEYVDARFREKQNFQKKNGHFLRFGIIVGFLF